MKIVIQFHGTCLVLCDHSWSWSRRRRGERPEQSRFSDLTAGLGCIWCSVKVCHRENFSNQTPRQFVKTRMNASWSKFFCSFDQNRQNIETGATWTNLDQSWKSLIVDYSPRLGSYYTIKVCDDSSRLAWLPADPSFLQFWSKSENLEMGANWSNLGQSLKSLIVNYFRRLGAYFTIKLCDGSSRLAWMPASHRGIRQ